MPKTRAKSTATPAASPPKTATTRAKAAKTTAPVQQAQAVTPPSQEAVAARAYEIFLREGAVHGRDTEHWLKAEQELLAERDWQRSERVSTKAKRGQPAA